MAAAVDLDRYLDRIGCRGPVAADEDGLRRIHAGQAFAVPFENLDIHLGRPLPLDPAALFDKMVARRRGGYCFELNGLLEAALRGLGFAVRPALARVLYGREDPGPRTHQALIVSVGGRDWLADVGFGGPGPRAPLPIEDGRVDEQFGERYRVDRDPGLGHVLRKEGKGGDKGAWIDLYAVADETTLPLDIAVSHFFTSQAPMSPFRRRRMAALPRPDGRTTLADMELSIHRGDDAETRTLPPGPAYLAALERHFGIVLDAGYDDLTPLPPTNAA